MQTHTIHFARNEGKHGITLLGALQVSTPNSILTTADALAALELSITQWVAETEEGRNSWDNSCSDYNIGDFLEDFRTESLVDQLSKNGLKILSLETYDVSGMVSYDKVLVDESAIPLEQVT